MTIFKACILSLFLLLMSINPREAKASTIMPVVVTVAPSTLQTIQAYWNFVWPVAGAVAGFLYVNRQKFFDCFTGLGKACCPSRYITPPDPTEELKMFLDSNLPHNVYALIEESYVLLRKACKKENTTSYENLGFSFYFPDEKLKYGFRKFSATVDTFTEKDFAPNLTTQTINYLKLKLKNGSIPESFMETAVDLYNKGNIHFVPYNNNEDFYFIAGWENGTEPKDQKIAFVINVDQNYQNDNVLDKLKTYGTFDDSHEVHISIEENTNKQPPIINKKDEKEDLLEKHN